jgi:prophage DNA circulation protein
MPDLYDATIDGFPLDIETLDDTFEKAIVRHEYPYKNGALLEDLGLKARVLRLRCWFWDSGGQQTYDDHIDFLEHLSKMEESELVHPKYGQLKGSIESVAVHHDDRERTAQIDISFVQGLITDSEDTNHEDVEAAGEESYNDGIADQQQEFADDVTAELGAEAPGILAVELDPDLGIVEQFAGVSVGARNFLKQVEAAVDILDATVASIVNPVNSLIGIIAFGQHLAGRVIGSACRCIERYALLYESLASSPARYLDTLIAGGQELADGSCRLNKTCTIAVAAHVALRAAYLYKADEKRRLWQKKNEGVRAFDVSGKYTAPEPPDADLPDETMTVGELESSLAAVRTCLQAAIDLGRGNTSLKRQALQLQTHVNTIKLEREKMIRVGLDNPMPLHLVCLRYGLPYTAAERLLTINSIVNPNRVAGEVNVYAA